ncbi:TPA: helix-turn-helix transcriptional regulator [Candidatus Ventrenecus avicola]|nr:helix-turn-helix transcriptional regulator [Candidatus Ventrenecus avicola]
MKLHEFCKLIRTKQGLSQKKFAKEMHLDLSTIVKIEFGELDNDNFLNFYFKLYYSGLVAVSRAKYYKKLLNKNHIEVDETEFDILFN